jgi:hypothetical protein
LISHLVAVPTLVHVAARDRGRLRVDVARDDPAVAGSADAIEIDE